MTDELDLAEHHSAEIDPHEKSKRGRLKDVLHRTRTKIADKVREEKDARKHSFHSDKDKPSPGFAQEVDDFLAAGRVSTASSGHPSLYSDAISSNENLPVAKEPSPQRPPTSDSKVHASPRRIQVPRIDVSGSQRFPNAKDVGIQSRHEQPGSSALSSASQGSASFLKPELKARNLSTSSIASTERKARIRGLSVGFADIPPAIIGEGGDEAETPTIEISRAKMRRARSASPQGRIIHPSSNAQFEARRPMPGRGVSDADTFVPKPFARVSTGMSKDGSNSDVSPVTGRDNFVPKPFFRTQTGLSETQSPQSTERAPPLPTRTKPDFLPHDLGRQQKGAMDLTREFEMSLGLSPTSPVTSQSLPAQEPRIFAPKPQRAPPSYDLIEGDQAKHRINQDIEPSVSTVQQQKVPQSSTTQISSQSPQPTQQMGHPEILHPASQRALPQQQQSAAAPMPAPPQPPLQQQQRQQGSQPVTLISQPVPPQVSQQHIPLRSPLSSSLFPNQSIRQVASPPESAKVQTPEPFIQQELHVNPHEYLNQMWRDESDIQPNHTSGPGVSRFASLHGQSTRQIASSSSQRTVLQHGQPKIPEQTQDFTLRTLAPLATSNEQNNQLSFAERVKTNSRPTSNSGSPTSVVLQSANLPRVSPLAGRDASPNNYSSAVASPLSPAEVQPNKMRFYEGINKGHPPAGFI